MKLSIVIPVYNEEQGLGALVERLSGLCDRQWEFDTEVILVDDHSADGTQALLRKIAAENKRFRYIRLTANRGSHIAVLAGLAHATGDCAAFLAADLQDPPELIPQMVDLWKQGNEIVWAVREERKGIGWSDRLFGIVFYFLISRLSQVNLGPKGSDFVLLDKRVVKALLKSAPASPVVMAEIARLGFHQAQIPYVKQARLHGKSKWNMRRKLKLFADAFVAHSYFPIRVMSYAGMIFSLLGLLYAVLIIVLRLLGNRPVEGWASLMVVVLVMGGIQMVMLGIMGEYIWRTLEEARCRPMYFIEESSDDALPAAAETAQSGSRHAS